MKSKNTEKNLLKEGIDHLHRKHQQVFDSVLQDNIFNWRGVAMLAMPFCSLYNKEKINSEVTEKDYPLRVVKGNEICAILKDKNFIDGRIESLRTD